MARVLPVRGEAVNLNAIGRRNAVEHDVFLHADVPILFKIGVEKEVLPLQSGIPIMVADAKSLVWGVVCMC